MKSDLLTLVTRQNPEMLSHLKGVKFHTWCVWGGRAGQFLAIFTLNHANMQTIFFFPFIVPNEFHHAVK